LEGRVGEVDGSTPSLTFGSYKVGLKGLEGRVGDVMGSTLLTNKILTTNNC